MLRYSAGLLALVLTACPGGGGLVSIHVAVVVPVALQKQLMAGPFAIVLHTKQQGLWRSQSHTVAVVCGTADSDLLVSDGLVFELARNESPSCMMMPEIEARAVPLSSDSTCGTANLPQEEQLLALPWSARGFTVATAKNSEFCVTSTEPARVVLEGAVGGNGK